MAKAPTAGATPAVTPSPWRPAAEPAGVTSTPVPGLVLRPVRWPEEATTIAEIGNAARRAADSLEVVTGEGLRIYYEHLDNCDLGTDLRIAEVDGRPVAYVRVEWRDEHRGDRIFGAIVIPRPDAPAGTFGALLEWAVARNLVKAASLPASERPRLLSAASWSDDAEAAAELEARRFTVVRFGYEMRRPTLDDIPDLPLPTGVETRPVRPEQRRAIFEAEVDAFAGHWGAGPDDGSERRWQEFERDPLNRDASLWQVAWAGDEVVGMVRPYINEEENVRFGVSRGWCENISTRAAWRGRGIASALICRALRALRDRGMTEAALSVDAQNETGAVRLYESMGFQVVARELEWRRPLDEGPGSGE
jgi:ribosomal protein S18 acetylase RimI-like enzyme